MRSTKIADTTREERIQIVAEALSWGDDCGDCSLDACGIDKFYEPYIEGEIELAELNMMKAAGALRAWHRRQVGDRRRLQLGLIMPCLPA
ncbi:MAG: hypothetical protein LKE27_08405 [Atopobiaceae bacterium]|jgi:hypothetical protein|nr:hypothetical protein [Atopobiaceae bacterium]